MYSPLLIGTPQIINRIPFYLNEQMKRDQTLEFVWRTSRSLNANTTIFTHVLDDHYSSPPCVHRSRRCAFQNNSLGARQRVLMAITGDLTSSDRWTTRPSLTRTLRIAAYNSLKWCESELRTTEPTDCSFHLVRHASTSMAPLAVSLRANRVRAEECNSSDEQGVTLSMWSRTGTSRTWIVSFRISRATRSSTSW